MPLAEESDISVPSKSTDLAFLRDLKEALLIVKVALEKNSSFLYLLAAFPLVDACSRIAGHPLPFLDWGMEFATCFAASCVIVLSYKKLRPEFNEGDVPGGSERRVLATSATYGLYVTLLSLFFVIPGVLFAAGACLATVFACLENRNPNDCIGQSQTLVKGHMLTAFSYAVFKPFLLWLCMTGAFLLITAVVNMTSGSAQALLDALTSGLMMFINAIFQLAIFPLLVRLYVRLKFLVNPAASFVVAQVEAPFAPVKIDDNKLNPRW